MFAKVILASKPTNGALPLITMHWRYPRIIHSEVMTHRVFSRNARSSRAVPVATMLKEIRETPFVPWHLGRNQKGMQAGEAFSPEGAAEIQRAWLVARDNAVESAEGMMEYGVHKQIANRLIEPFSFIDTLVSSTSWANFRHLRDHKDAEPHFQDLAKMVVEAIDGAEFDELFPGDWHLPYITDEDRSTVVWWIVNNRQPPHNIPSAEAVSEILLKLSVARCARISYAPFDGDASIEKELQRYDMLVGSDPLHASPTEHQAQQDTLGHYERNFIDENGKEELLEGGLNWNNAHLSGNLAPGWIQYRKTLAGEYIEDVAA